MLKDAGATWVIVGHSERRQHHGETDAMVAAKAKAAWRADFSRSSASVKPTRSGEPASAVRVCRSDRGKRARGISPRSAMRLVMNRYGRSEPAIRPVSRRLGRCTAYSSVSRRALGLPRQGGPHPLRRIRKPDERIRGPCGAGGRRRAGRWREPEAKDFEAIISAIPVACLTAFNHSA
jgi:hypothetical protein